MPQDKIRVYALARELNMDSKDLLDICRGANIDVRNQLSSLEPEQRDQIVEMIRSGGGTTTATTAPPSSPAPRDLPQTEPGRVRNLKPRPASSPREEKPKVEEKPAPTQKEASPPKVEKTPEPEEAKTVSEKTSTPEIEDEKPSTPPEEPKTPVTATETVKEKEEEKPSETQKPAASTKPAEPEKKSDPEKKPTESPKPPSAPAEEKKEEEKTPPPMPQTNRPPVRNLDRPSRGEGGSRERGKRPIPRPGGRNIQLATPPPIKKPASSASSKTSSEKEKEKPKKSGQGGVKKISDVTPDMLKGGGSIFDKLTRQARARDAQPQVEEEEEAPKGDGKGGKGKGVAGRNQRHRAREERGRARRSSGRSATALLNTEGGNEEEQRRRLQRRRKNQRGRGGPKQDTAKPRKDSKIPIELPITVRSLSEAIGVPAGEILKQLMQEGMMATINQVLEPEMAETLALDLGHELDVKRPLNAEEQLEQEAQKEDADEDLELRAPIVTIMGHVDHGKTSLLDRIRESNVVDTEVGGITQSIRAWRVEHDGKPVTFLDTPGHEAFTQMRARGANVTDIAVIVVAADDGIMPQTEEAINHAKAADVAIVVAINKIDLPNANRAKTEQQLYSKELIPDTMGGDVPFVYTSATTGEGIDELLETLSVVAELKELKANPNKPAQGTCLEASISEKEGVTATILVREGTLKRNDVVICGSTFGAVRAMFDDRGKPIEEAGPSVPVRILGLDDVPNADDPFLVVPDVATAGKIAEKRRKRVQEEALAPRGPLRLEDLTAGEVIELKIILKADVKGSLEAIKKEMEKLKHDEVRVNLLMASVGGITENDVNLALTAPESTIIVGFNAVPDDRAKSLAEEKGIEIRQYGIIYNLTDDIKSALEGKLKPREEVIHLGRAVVRQLFKVSRTGTIAGCYVTQGSIERSAQVRVIRNGVVVYPPAERHANLESLRRHKDDAKEVQQGYECGMKIAGYDDVKVDDVIEAFRVEKIQRTLDEG